MKVQIFLMVNDIEEAEQFYTKELKMFSIIFSEMRGTLLRHVKHDYFELFLEKNRNTVDIPDSNEPIFAIETYNCKEEFARIRTINFLSGGYIYKHKDEKEPSTLEYPLGESFLMIDPSGNRFIIYEDFYYGTKSTYEHNKPQ